MFQKQGYDYAVAEYNAFFVKIGEGRAVLNGNNVSLTVSSFMGTYTANLFINGNVINGTALVFGVYQNVIAYRG